MSYLLMTVIGCPVSMFFAKFTKPRIWETAREPFGDNSITGSASSIAYVVSPFWKKKVNCAHFHFWYITYLKVIRTIELNCLLTVLYMLTSVVTWIVLLCISVICLLRSWIVKGEMVFGLPLTGDHSSACSWNRFSNHQVCISIFVSKLCQMNNLHSYIL